MKALTSQKCVPCEGGTAPLTKDQIGTYLGQIPQWFVAEDAKSVTREYTFKDFALAVSFVDKVAQIAEQEGHHPDILIHGWNKVRLTNSTHAIRGLSVNDFILAAKADRLYE